MFRKKCQFCGESVQKEWKFCPQCGRPLHTQGLNISGINIDVTKMIGQIMPQILNGVMNSNFAGTDNQQKNKSRYSKKGETASRMGNVSKVLEPEDIVSNYGDTVVHSIALPGVMDRSDIDINKMENSIEVRALSGDRMYLKIIKREKGQGLVSQEFVNESLVLVLKKT